MTFIVAGMMVGGFVAYNAARVENSAEQHIIEVQQADIDKAWATLDAEDEQHTKYFRIRRNENRAWAIVYPHRNGKPDGFIEIELFCDGDEERTWRVFDEEGNGWGGQLPLLKATNWPGHENVYVVVQDYRGFGNWALSQAKQGAFSDSPTAKQIAEMPPEKLAEFGDGVYMLGIHAARADYSNSWVFHDGSALVPLDVWRRFNTDTNPRAALPRPPVAPENESIQL